MLSRAILDSMVAMLFTGISYGRIARAYPSAGSAFTYRGHTAKELNPGSRIGPPGWSKWSLDYMLNPLICTVMVRRTRPAVLRRAAPP